MNKIILIFGILLFGINTSMSQYTACYTVSQKTIFDKFNSKPIQIQVKVKEKAIFFSAINNSSYPYQLTIIFSNLKNLKPLRKIEKFQLNPGTNQLLKFTRNDQTKPIDYSYKILYDIGIRKKEISMKYPYLFPIKPNNCINVRYSKKRYKKFYFADHFDTEVSDTIYAMRKGLVTASLNTNENVDRISPNNSIEVIHKDGSIMCYEIFGQDKSFVKNGDKVYPGQPIALVGNCGFFRVNLYKLNGGKELIRKDINYVINKNSITKFTNQLDQKTVKHPENIVKMEMTTNEKRKYKKGKLY